MKKFALMLALCFLMCGVFSACGNAEPEITAAEVTEVHSETTSETAAEATVSATTESYVSSVQSETEATTEATLSSEELARQEVIEGKFRRVMEDFTHAEFNLYNEVPGGENGIADIASDMWVSYDVALEDEMLEDIRSVFSEPYFTVEEDAEWYEEDYTVVVVLARYSGLTSEDDECKFYFRYNPNDSAENSELLPLCYTVVGSKTYVLRMNENAVSFLDDKLDGLYVRSADTRSVGVIPEDERTEAPTDTVSAELTEEEKNQQAAIDGTVAIRIKLTPFMFSWEDDIREHIMDSMCVYEITDEAIISEIVSELDKSNMKKYDEPLGFGRGGPWAYSITFVSANGEENTYFFDRDYTDVYDTGVYFTGITFIDGTEYDYGLSDRTIRFLDNLFRNLDFKTVTTR